jgi:hypothetical protein
VILGYCALVSITLGRKTIDRILPKVTHTRIVAIITDTLCRAATEPMPLIKSPQNSRPASLPGAGGPNHSIGEAANEFFHQRVEAFRFVHNKCAAKDAVNPQHARNSLPGMRSVAGTQAALNMCY